MALKGLSLDGAAKLEAALDNYLKGFSNGGAGWSSSAYYGKDTKVSKLFDDIMHYVYSTGRNGKSTLSSYKNQLNQVIKTYKGFDNTGSNTLGKIIPTTQNKKS